MSKHSTRGKSTNIIVNSVFSVSTKSIPRTKTFSIQAVPGFGQTSFEVRDVSDTLTFTLCESVFET